MLRENARDPGARECERLARRTRESREVFFEGRPSLTQLELGVQRLDDRDREAARGEPRLGTAELVDEIRRRGLGVAGELLARRERSDRARDLGGELLARAAIAEHAREAREALRSALPALARVDLRGNRRNPVQRSEHAWRSGIRQQARTVAHREQLRENLRGIGIVDAALVALVVTLLCDVADERLQPATPRRISEHRRIVIGKDARREVLAAIHRIRFARQILRPQPARFFERGLVDRFVEIGAGEVNREALLVRHDHELERLRVDREAMVAKFDQLAVATLEQIHAITLTAQRILLRRFDLGLELVGLDRIAERRQLAADIADLLDHRIGGEVRVDLVGGRELGRSSRHALHDPLCRPVEVRRAALALGREDLLARTHGLDDLDPLGRQLGRELVDVGEPALEILELDEQPRELLIAALRRIALRERRGDGLGEQLDLRAELRAAFAGRELAIANIDGRARAIDLTERIRDRLEDRGALRGVVDLERADHVAEQVDPGSDLVDHFADRLDLDRTLDARDALRLLGRRGDERAERITFREEVDRVGGHPIERDRDRGLERAEPRLVNEPNILLRDQLAPRAAQCGQRFEELLDPVVPFGAGRLQPLRDHGFRFCEHALGFAFERDDLLVLVKDQLRGRFDVTDRGLEITGIGVAEPVVRIGGAGRERENILEGRALRLVIAREPRDREGIGEPAHEVRIANLAEVAAVGRRARRVLRRGKRGLPHLHRVDARGLADHATHHDHPPIAEQRIAVALDRRGDRLVDQVVDVEPVTAVTAAKVDVLDIFTIRRSNLVLEHVVARITIEQLVVATDEHVAAGEHDAVILGQRPTAVTDAIGAHDLVRARIEHEVAPCGLAKRQDLEDDQASWFAALWLPDRRVEHARVVE